MLPKLTKSLGSIEQSEQNWQLPVTLDHRQRGLDATCQRGAFSGEGQQLDVILSHGFISISS